MDKKIGIRYNGKRYPRTVNLRGGSKISFIQGRDIIFLDEYDALYLLKFNSRIQPEKWEFTIEPVPGEIKIIQRNIIDEPLIDKNESKIDKRSKEFRNTKSKEAI